MVEYLGLADYLLIAEAVLDVPAEVLVLSASLHLVPRQATFARLMVAARLTTLRRCGSVAWRLRQAM